MSEAAPHSRVQSLLWLAQRASAAVLALCVIVHLATIVYAARHGFSAADILSRTRSGAAWPLFYTLFTVAIAVHASIGLRAIAAEWLGWRGMLLETATAATGVALLFAGLRAVWAVTT